MNINKYSHKLLHGKGLVAILLLLAIVVVFLLPIDVPFSYGTYGRILPGNDYVLRMSENGIVQSLLRDNLHGGISRSSMNEIDRGDAVWVEMNKEVQSKGWVSFGDTLCRISSSLLSVTLAERVGALAVAESSLAVAASGDKSSLIQAARERIDFSTKEVEAFAKKHERLETLFAKQLVSEEQVVDSRDQLRLLEISVDIAEAELNVLTTGSKTEELNLRSTNILALQNEIDALQSRASMFVHVSPVSGIIPGSSNSDTLLRVYDTTSALIEVAVNIEAMEYIHYGATVRASLPGMNGDVEARIVRIEKTPRIWGRDKVVLVYAEIEYSKGLLPWDSLTKCSIDCGNVELSLYAWRHLKTWLGIS
jgi:hypothetical protein